MWERIEKGTLFVSLRRTIRPGDDDNPAPFSSSCMTLRLKVSKVLVSRARGADLALNNFYDILYSFHTLKGNFRQGIYMRNIIIIIIILSSCQLLFSCANAPLVWHSSVLASTRCKNRYTFPISIETTRHGFFSKAECYLAALNSLRLVSKKHAWIVRPSQWEGIAVSAQLTKAMRIRRCV